MKRQDAMVWLFGLCVPVLFGNVRAFPMDSMETNLEECNLTVSLMALSITSKRVEFRCEIKNNTEEDIWVCTEACGVYQVDAVRGTNAKVLMDEDGKTLLILKRMESPQAAAWGDKVVGRYDRITPHESRGETLLVVLPGALRPSYDASLSRAIDRNLKEISRLAFEIGYYTAGDLRSLSDPTGDTRIRFDASGQRAFLHDYEGIGIWAYERAIRVGISGLHIPLAQLLRRERHIAYDPPLAIVQKLRRVFFENKETLPVSELRYSEELFQCGPDLFDGVARRLADIYSDLAEGRLDPNDLLSTLDNVLGQAERQTLLDELRKKQVLLTAPESSRSTPIQSLQDLFYSFAIDMEQYEYALQLMAIDKRLLNEPAKRILDVYAQVTQGRIGPGELARHLDEALSRTGREKLLQDLQEKQAAMERRINPRNATRPFGDGASDPIAQ